MDAESADEDAQQQRDQARFRAGVRVNGFCRCHGAAALWADDGLVDQLRAAMSAVFHGVSPSFAAAAAAILVTWRRYLSCDKISVAFRRWLVNSGAALAAEICRLRSKNRPGSDAPGADSENCREMLAFFALL